MAYISFQPSDFFSAIPFVGNTGGVPTTVTGVGFQPDWVWFCNREVINDRWIFDSVRGVEKYIESNTTQVDTTDVQGLQSFNADGFTVGDANPINQNTKDIISWNWKMGTTSGIAGSPSITPSSYSFSATAGQSIIAYTGNVTSGATLPHGLGVAPKMIIVKALESADPWTIYHSAADATAPEDKYMVLDTSAAVADATWAWNDTAPTSTLFSLGNAGEVNASGSDYIAYCFADVKGYSRFGGYTGNGTADGAFIYTGFRPAFVLIKSTSGAGSWAMFDDKRDGYNVDNDHVSANTTEVEQTDNTIDIVSNGFKARNTTNQVNGSGWIYVYMAFAKNPIVSSNGVPTVAR